jgi:D-alanyl-D-alanine carboxypeptidase (penicillin-binding protein 5/6)
VAATAALGAPLGVASAETHGGPVLSSPGVHVGAGASTPLPQVAAESFVLADADTGEVLAAKNAHLPLLPASTLKMLTAVSLMDSLDPDETYTPTYEDVSVEGSKVGIVNGSTYTIDQLWYGLFLASGNDSALALARANGGMKKSVAEMNETAVRLNADNTVARNTNGLDAKGQQSTAYDLALITRAGWQDDDFRRYAGAIKVEFPRAGKKAKRDTFMVYNHNPLIAGAYRGAVGGKTGYTDAARRTFIGVAERGGRTLIATFMKYEVNTYTMASALLSWGFKNADGLDPVGTLVEPDPETEVNDTGADAEAGASTGGETQAAAATGDDGTSVLPFLLLGVTVVAIVVLYLSGRLRPRRDPLAAANRGRGSGGRPAGPPRGRDGIGRY